MKELFVKRLFFCLTIFCFLLFPLCAETIKTENEGQPHIFHNIGWNLLNSVTYNYGTNFAGAGLGTWVMIETGIDWKWRNFIFDNEQIAKPGSVVMSTGGLVPILTPLAFLISGKAADNDRAVIAASALTQTVILTMAVQSPLKMITGRRDPGLVNNSFYERIYGEDDFSGVFNWFNMDFFNGWPSGHTANAFSAAATLSEIYHDNIWVKTGVFTYATLMGLGVTLHAHWASEAVAGALIGYAIGKTVGKSYRKFLNKPGYSSPITNSSQSNYRKAKTDLSFYCTSDSAGIIIRL